MPAADADNFKVFPVGIIVEIAFEDMKIASISVLNILKVEHFLKNKYIVHLLTPFLTAKASKSATLYCTVTIAVPAAHDVVTGGATVYS